MNRIIVFGLKGVDMIKSDVERRQTRGGDMGANSRDCGLEKVRMDEGVKEGYVSSPTGI